MTSYYPYLDEMIFKYYWFISPLQLHIFHHPVLQISHLDDCPISISNPSKIYSHNSCSICVHNFSVISILYLIFAVYDY